MNSPHGCTTCELWTKGWREQVKWNSMHSLMLYMSGWNTPNLQSMSQIQYACHALSNYHVTTITHASCLGRYQRPSLPKRTAVLNIANWIYTHTSLASVEQIEMILEERVNSYTISTSTQSTGLCKDHYTQICFHVHQLHHMHHVVWNQKKRKYLINTALLVEKDIQERIHNVAVYLNSIVHQQVKKCFHNEPQRYVTLMWVHTWRW